MIYERINETEFVRLVKEDNSSSLQDASDEGVVALYDFLNESGEDVEFDGIGIRCQFSFNDYEDLINEYGAELAEELEEPSPEDVNGHSNQELRPVLERVIENSGYATLVHIDDEGAILSQ